MKTFPHWTKRAATRLRDAARYIALNFYEDYAIAFRDDAIETANEIQKNPEIGKDAFPTLRFPAYRKILCKNRHWWIFYRIKKDCIEIVSVKHILQRVDSPLDL